MLLLSLFNRSNLTIAALLSTDGLTLGRRDVGCFRETYHRGRLRLRLFSAFKARVLVELVYVEIVIFGCLFGH